MATCHVSLDQTPQDERCVILTFGPHRRDLGLPLLSPSHLALPEPLPHTASASASTSIFPPASPTPNQYSTLLPCFYPISPCWTPTLYRRPLRRDISESLCVNFACLREQC